MRAAWEWWQGQWPQVYPNLIAGAIQGAAVYAWARRHVRKIHARLDRIHHHVTKQKEGGDEPQGS